MKIVLAQVNPTVGDLDGNLNLIIQAIKKALNNKARLIVFSELCLIGYPPKDLLFDIAFLEKAEEALFKLVKKIEDFYVLIGTIWVSRKKEKRQVFNTAVLIYQKKVIQKIAKRRLPNYDVFDEKRYFSIPQDRFPQSNFINIDQEKFLVTICEDICKSSLLPPYIQYEDFLDQFSKKNQNLNGIINLAASPFSIEKLEEREISAKNFACYFKSSLYYVNQVGGHDDLIFDGSSFIMNEKGEVTQKLASFKQDLLCTELKQVKKTRVKQNPIALIEEALVLGLRDYAKKCFFKTVLIGLSGGIDSAVVAVIAKKSLGAKNVFCVAMPSRFSSKASLLDAKKLATNLNVSLEIISIEPTFKALLRSLKTSFKKTPFSLAEENLQARTRGTILMALSNKWNHLLLATANKSEFSVGYSTLYGDMNGGLCPLGDLFKTKVYQLASYINQKEEIIPNDILKKAPSAELRFNQKDTDTLPAYEILDALLEAYLEKGIGKQELVKMGFDRGIIEQVLFQIHRNEYKRNQAPLILKITPKSFGFGRRVPISKNWQNLFKNK